MTYNNTRKFVIVIDDTVRAKLLQKKCMNPKTNQNLILNPIGL